MRQEIHFHLQLDLGGTTVSAKSSSGNAFIPFSLDVRLQSGRVSSTSHLELILDLRGRCFWRIYFAQLTVSLLVITASSLTALHSRYVLTAVRLCELRMCVLFRSKAGPRLPILMVRLRCKQNLFVQSFVCLLPHNNEGCTYKDQRQPTHQLTHNNTHISLRRQHTTGTHTRECRGSVLQQQEKAIGVCACACDHYNISPSRNRFMRRSVPGFASEIGLRRDHCRP